MPRRHRPPESAHVMRWMVSYADFVTLLLAFFVVLYTVSSVNHKKFDQISSALEGVFERQARSMKPISLEGIFPAIVSQISQDEPSEEEVYLADSEAAFESLQQALKPQLEAKEYSLIESEQWIHLEIPSDEIFNEKTDVITPQGGAILNLLASAFSEFGNAINVEAFSTPEPQQTLSDENLWQLSALQAAAVTYHLIMEGIDPQRLAAVGYGPYQPIATAEDEEGQALNRRLVFMIDRTPNQRKRIKTVTKRHLSAKPNE